MNDTSLAAVVAAAAPARASADAATERADAALAAREEGRRAGAEAGAQAERSRIAAILDCEEAKGRGALARHFALKTAMSPDDARAALAAAPVETPSAAPQVRMIPDPKVDASESKTSVEASADAGLLASAKRFAASIKR